MQMMKTMDTKRKQTYLSKDENFYQWFQLLKITSLSFVLGDTNWEGLISSEHSEMVASKEETVNIGENTSGMDILGFFASFSLNFCHIFG